MISFYKSIVDQDRASIVICNLKHEIIYMNPAAVNSYAKRGGDKLIGRSLLDCHNQESRDKIQKVVDWFAADESHMNNPVPVSLLSGDRKPQIRFLGNHHSGSGNLYHKSFRM